VIKITGASIITRQESAVVQNKSVEGEKIYVALMNILSASLRWRLATFTMDAFALSHNQ
jgi:hypothetical protein